MSSIFNIDITSLYVALQLKRQTDKKHEKMLYDEKCHT